ncbi:gamma-glutamyltransferase [Pannonibacter sp. SL95]|uniref:gamma-glutamyltransferase n=1 Tax=Pannonibacter sp. SL95 TaxID=2995153 RepID=UPI00227597DE|nr:gamma-glutamyltransferase [Pannonibacter sp. SL95]MCY1706604.1 gamma-glutamyltransferase [Pannonibacter sp. SL95]
MARNFDLPGRSPVIASRGMAATSHPLSTSAAIEILQDGGNAVDAAIAAVAVQCVVEPHMTGLGGDCFAIVTEADGHMAGFNGSGAAPRAISTAALRDQGLSEITPDSVHAITVPGAVRAWETLLKAHGSKPLKKLLRRAISYARDGFPVAPRVAHDWVHSVGKLAADPASASTYLVNGEAPKAGDILRLPRLADTLSAIASGGADAFYTGDIAQDIVATLRARGSFMTLDDLAACHTTAVAPVLKDYRGHTIAELPPNGQGLVALIMLGLLERFDGAALDPMSPERLHLQMEAARLAYAMRNRFIADPGHMDVCHSALISPEALDQLAAQISPDKRNDAIAVPSLAPQTDTVYISVVDKDGLAVSFINSIFKEFGSGVLAPQSGVLLHNRGCSFRVEPGHPNTIEGGKRPMHTILPAFGLKDGAPWMSFGVMGGHYQPCGHVHVLTNMIDHGMDVQEAIDAPRLFLDDTFTKLQVESGIPEAAVAGLAARGHDVVRASAPIGGAQAIQIDRKRGTLTGGSDPRKDGHAAGY